MTVKELKAKALKEYKELKRLIKKEPPVFKDFYENLKQYPLFKRYTYISEKNEYCEFHYSNMTLSFKVNCGIIELNSNIKLWNENDIGFVGDYTEKTLSMESSSKLD